VLRRCVWSRNIKNRCSIYIYDISSLRVNDDKTYDGKQYDAAAANDDDDDGDDDDDDDDHHHHHHHHHHHRHHHGRVRECDYDANDDKKM